MARLLTVLAALLCLLGPGAALAHRGHATLSVVEIDPASGAMTVTHHMAAHDVEPAMALIAPDEQASIDNPAALDAFVAHVARGFSVNATPLVFERSEARGDDLVLVFRGRLEVPVTRVEVRADLLPATEVEEPEFQVNVRLGKVTRTLVFTAASGPQTLLFD